MGQYMLQLPLTSLGCGQTVKSTFDFSLFLVLAACRAVRSVVPPLDCSPTFLPSYEIQIISRC